MFAGRRVMKWIKVWAGSDWVEEASHAFIYNGWNMIRETVTQGPETRPYSHQIMLQLGDTWKEREDPFHWRILSTYAIRF